ncbi:MAG TPA: diguanylate cyclase, partial [Verrucomicrobiae bacterium]|nr:diguanylate cyclase [Verrucomicrobiae bacterium]
MGRPLDYRTDFYSLGMTLYRMLTGQSPFAADDPLEWAHCHIARIPPSPRDLAPATPQAVADIVMKLLAKAPEDRYQSAYGLRRDLERCLSEQQANGRIETFPLGLEDFSERFQIPRKLYGREQEATALLAAFDRMAATGRRTLVAVSGYAGVGKSSLVDALRRPIVEKHGYFIAGKFDQYLRDIPYATIAQACRELIRQLLAESETRVADWRRRIQEAVGANGQLIVDVLPQVELIIGKQPPTPELPPNDAQHRFRRVFRQFLNVFAQPAHPLVLFLDDLQWIDAASLQLIEYLFTDSDTGHLLLIATYRDNEISAAHPLLPALDAIRRGKAAVTDIRLEPLPIEPLNQLVADMLHAAPASSEPLTRLVFAKTEGNPFFFTQFLGSLHKEGWLWFDVNDRAWRWNLDQIQACDFADNVADLMVSKLRRQPAPTQEALQLAACLGNKFDLRHLALAGGIAQPEVERRLSAALQEGVIMRTANAGKFLHDRIQQAAYSLIEPERRNAIHLAIGRALLASLSEAELDTRLFDVANQFNRGAALLVDPQERAKIAEINLRAGRKAKASIAYASACVYLAAGMALLEEAAWETRRQLAFDLWFERAHCEFLSGHLNEAMEFLTALLPRALPKADLAKAYHLKAVLHVVRSENSEARDTALACIRLFGIDLPAHPSWRQVRSEYDQVWRNLGERSIESLVDLPLMTDPDIQAVMRVLSALALTAVFTHNQNLVYLIYSRMVNLSLRHGSIAESAYGYAGFQWILGPVFHRYRDAYHFAQLACALVDKHGFAAMKAKTYFLASFSSAWTQPIAAVLDFVRAAFNAGIETGDFAYASYSSVFEVSDMLVAGAPLDTIWRKSEKALAYVRQYRFRDTEVMIVAQQRFIAALQGRTAALSDFGDATFDEDAFEAKFRMRQIYCWWWIYKLEAGFLADDYAAAFLAIRKVEPWRWTTSIQIQFIPYHYYSALTMAAVYNAAGPNDRLTWRTRLQALQEQLREWADNNPSTFGDKHALVSAEIARLDGRDLDAMRLYQQAIAAAHDNGFVQNEGVARELAAKFYLTRGFATEGNAHLVEARNCFARWGADGKVAQLEAHHPILRAQSAGASALAMNGDATQLDVLSVTKASQAISGSLLLEELVEALLRLTLENGGAQSGALLLARNDALTLFADASVEQQTVRVRRFEPASSDACLPTSILNYVRRTREQVLLADVAQANPFSTDDYFARRRPKSILCLPILRQDALLGVLYLENSLVAHAFTPARLTVLELLAAQAAISLENAQLYADLGEREARIRRLVESNIIGVFFWTLDGGVWEANEAFLQLLGYSRDDVRAGQVRWDKMTPPEYRDAEAREAAKIKQTGKFERYEKEYIRKDGSRVPVMIGAAFLEGSQDRGVAFVVDLTEQKRAEADIRYLAHYDALTGLPNRVLLQDRMRQAIAHASREGTQVAILFIDLDHFKHINDSLGHSIGDRLLQMAATRLRQCVREDDGIGRLGGDEFVLSLSLPSVHHAARTAEKILAAFRPAFAIEGHELHVNGSIGVSVYPDDGADVESLMRAADTAMYYAKDNGRGNYQFFTPALNQATQQRLELT